MDGYSVWDEASRDYDAEARIVAQANFRVASSGVMHFLALAESRDEFDGRLMLAASQVRALADESGLSLDEVTSSLRNRWEMIHEAGFMQKGRELAEQAKAGLGEAAEQAKAKAGETADAVGNAASGAASALGDAAEKAADAATPHIEKAVQTGGEVAGEFGGNLVNRAPAIGGVLADEVLGHPIRTITRPTHTLKKVIKGIAPEVAGAAVDTVRNRRNRTASADGKVPCYGVEMAATGGDDGDGICPDDAMVDPSVGVCDACASEAKDWYTRNWNTKESSRRTAGKVPCMGVEMWRSGGDRSDLGCDSQAMVDPGVGVCDDCASDAEYRYGTMPPHEASRRTAGPYHEDLPIEHINNIYEHMKNDHDYNPRIVRDGEYVPWSLEDKQRLWGSTLSLHSAQHTGEDADNPKEAREWLDHTHTGDDSDLASDIDLDLSRPGLPPYEGSRRTAARGVRQEGGRWKVVDDQGNTVSVHDTKEQAVSSYKSMKRTKQPKSTSVKKPASTTASRPNFNQAVTDDSACEGCGSYDESLSRGDSFCGRCVSAGIPDLMNSSVHERKKNAENNRRRRASLSEQVWDDIYKMAEWKVGDPDPATTRSNRSPEATPGTPEHKELLTQENDKRKRDKDAEVNRRSKEQQTRWIQNNTATSSRKIGDKSRCGHVEAEQTFIHGDPDMGLQFKCDSCGKNAGACCGTAVDAGDRMMFFCGPCHDESNMELDDYAHKQASFQVVGVILQCRNCGKTADLSEFGQNQGPVCPDCGSNEVFENGQQTTANYKNAAANPNTPQGMNDYGQNEGPNLAGAKFTPDGSSPDIPSKSPAKSNNNPNQFNPKSNGGDIGMGFGPDTSSMYDSTTTASKADLLVATAMVLENNPQLSDDEAQKIAFSVLSIMIVEAADNPLSYGTAPVNSPVGPFSKILSDTVVKGVDSLVNKVAPGPAGAILKGPEQTSQLINKSLDKSVTNLVNKKITSSPKSNATAKPPKAAPVAKPATEQVSQTGETAPADATEQKPQSFGRDLVDNYSQPGVAREIWKDIAEVSVGAVGTATPLAATYIPEMVMEHGAENLVRDVGRPIKQTIEERRQPASQPSQAPQPKGPGKPTSA